VKAPVIVMASGVWDVFHVGHINLLWRAKSFGDLLVVGVVSDIGTNAYKGRFPKEHEQVRIERIERLGFVDVALLQDGTDPSPLLERIRPDILVHGDDWSELRQGQDTVERLGIDWKLVPYTPGVSTSMLRRVV
jgi:cytidyltransferase-like protein